MRRTSWGILWILLPGHDPEPNFQLLDRFLVMMEYQQIPVHICFNKADLLTKEEQDDLCGIYDAAGYQVLFTDAQKGTGVEEIRSLLADKTTTVAGPSGVGKSTLVNCLMEDAVMETGAISEKIRRGRHTTRHSELLYLGENTFLMDTPGFSSMYLPEFEKEDLKNCYPEFLPYSGDCRFLGCSHTHEPDCAVKQALEEGRISPVRYENYKYLYHELEQAKKY